MITITSHDTALNLVYAELKGQSVATIRTHTHRMLSAGEITLEVYENVQGIIRRRGN